jgi:SAM-dependent methyltransferase
MTAPRRFHKRLISRRTIDRPLDWLRFRLDTFPSLDYQPLPWLGVADAGRAVGTKTRWSEIERLAAELDCRTGLDIGCNVGFFTFSLASRGSYTIGVEREAKFVRTFLYAQRRLHNPRSALLTLDLAPDTVSLLPSAQIVLFMSVWHHILREFGMEAARGILSAVWGHTQKALVFDTGESEMPPEYGLPPLEPSPAQWVENLLQSECKGGVVRHAGLHDAFDPEGRRCQRNLFVVTRSA